MTERGPISFGQGPCEALDGPHASSGWIMELAQPVPLVVDGRLNPAAIGWSRTPLVSADLSAVPSRRQRWDYWCVWDDTLLACFAVADVERIVTAFGFVHDLRQGRAIASVNRVHAFRRERFAFGERPDKPTTYERGSDSFRFEPVPTGVALNVQTAGFGATLEVHRPPAEETMNFTVDFGGGRFQHNGKHVGLPVSGTLRFGRRSHTFEKDRSFATLDFGRGRWPDTARWYWGSGAGWIDGRRIGLNLEGRWTDTNPGFGNALTIDGRLHALETPIAFRPNERADDALRLRDYDAPWRIDSRDDDRVRLTFRPDYGRRTTGVVPTRLTPGMRVHQCFGTFHGTIRTGSGDVAVDGMTGWAEACRVRW